MRGKSVDADATSQKTCSDHLGMEGPSVEIRRSWGAGHRTKPTVAWAKTRLLWTSPDSPCAAWEMRRDHPVSTRSRRVQLLALSVSTPASAILFSSIRLRPWIDSELVVHRSCRLRYQTEPIPTLVQLQLRNQRSAFLRIEASRSNGAELLRTPKIPNQTPP